MREEVQADDYRRLGPAEWLNDVIVNAYVALLLERSEKWKAQHSATPLSPTINGVNKGKAKAQNSSERAPLDVHVFNSFFYAKLLDPGYEKARLGRWTKKVCYPVLSVSDIYRYRAFSRRLIYSQKMPALCR